MTTDRNDATIRLQEGAAVWREMDGETVVLALDSSEYLGLNRTATTLWPAIVEGTTRDALVGRLVDAFEIEEDRAVADVDAFVETCRSRGLLA